MKRVTRTALVLTAVGLVDGVTLAAGSPSPAAIILPEAAPVPGGITVAKAPVPTAAPASAATGAAREATTGPVPDPDPAEEQAAMKAVPRRPATPAPFIQNFAAQPGLARQKPKGKPAAPVKVAPTIDGCDRNYGTIAQCIPIVFPKGVTDKCGWLTAHGFTALKVMGKDRQRLDRDRDGIACDGSEG
jgi:hypothetical protein